MLSRERRDRNRPDRLSGLSQRESPALQTPVGAGPSLCFRGNPSLALRSLRGAILFTLVAVSHAPVRALQNLRQFGIAARLRGAHYRHDFRHRTFTGIPGVALRPLPAQIFFRAPALPRRATSSRRPKQVARTAAALALNKQNVECCCCGVRAARTERGTKNVPRESPGPRYNTAFFWYP